MGVKLQSDAPSSCKLCYNKLKSCAGVTGHVNKVHKAGKKYLKMELTEDLLRFKCASCELKFVTKDVLGVHMKNKHGDNECKLCYRVLHTANIAAHMKNIHKDDTELLNRVIDSSELKFVCAKCPMKFVKESFVEMHKKGAHFVNTDNECKLCYKKMSRYQVPKHMEFVHKEDKEDFDRAILDSELKYSCKQCPRKFIKESIVDIHKRRVHVAISDNSCKLC